MDLLGTDMDAFIALMNTDVADTFFNDTVIWVREKTQLNLYKEDNAGASKASVTLKCLINYNYLRSWPITKNYEQGEEDGQSMQVLFNKEYLKGLGYLDSNGLFIYNQDFDRFIVDGLIHKPVGDGSVSQVKNGALLFEVILIRQKVNTGDKR